MANGLMGLSDLLGQSSNTQSGGLFGGGVFSQPESRGQRRSRLLTEAISGAGQNPYARLGASFGGLIGMGGRAAAEGLGIVDAPPEVQQAEAIRQVQQEVAEQGLDPMANPREFGDFVAGRFQELGQPQLATRSLLQARQIESEFAPEPVETERVVSGDSEIGQQLGLGQGETAIASFTDGVPTGIKDRQMPDEGGVNVGAATRFVNTDTGETLSLVRTDQGFARQSVDAQGNAVFTPADMSNLEPVSARETGGAGSFGGGGDFSDLGKLRNVTIDFAERANQLKSELRAGVVGIPAGVASTYASASSQISSILEETLGITDSSPKVVSAYSDSFEDLNLSNASSEVKSALLGAARVNAYLQQGGTGDTRKSEIEDSLRQLRIGSGNPEAIAAALGRTTEDAIRRFNIALGTASLATEEEVPFDELRPEDYGLGAAAAEQSGALTIERVEGLSMSDLQDLDPKQIPNDPRILQAIDNRLNELEDQMGSRVRGGGAR